MSDATNGNECRSGASRNAATATDSAPTLLDRRMYLKLTGAAAASLVTAGASGTGAAAEYEVIEVPAGANEDIAVRSGETFENKLIDVSAHDAELEINARGAGWTIRNVGFLGPTTNSLERRSRGSKVLNLAGDGLVENVYLGDGVDPDPDGSERNMSRDGGIYLHGDDHTGHIEVRRSNVSLWADNGCYCSGPGAQRGSDDGGTVQFTDCYMENNNVSGIRLGTNGSGARNCTIVIDDESAMPGVPRKPEPQIPVKHGRGFWIREGTSAEGVLIEDCDVSCTLDDTHEAVKINDGSACTIRNSRFEGEIDVNGRLRRENLSGDPDLSPPDGVPMSPEEAASGNSNGGGGSDDDPGVCDNVDHRESNPEVDDNYGNRPGYLAIDWLRFNRDSEGWSKGDPEFEFKVTRHYADSDEEQIHSNSEIYGMIQDDEYDDKVCFKKVLFEWKKEKHPSQYFAWHEFDGDNDTKLFTLDGSFKTPAGDFSFEEWSVTIHHNDDELGEAMIEDTEVDPVTYKGTGMPDMQLRLIE